MENYLTYNLNTAISTYKKSHEKSLSYEKNHIWNLHSPVQNQ